MVNSNSNDIISCDGTDQDSDKKSKNISKHPLVYFKLSSGKNIECPYCGKDFSNKKTIINEHE